jgi:hypothetical protein
MCKEQCPCEDVDFDMWDWDDYFFKFVNGRFTFGGSVSTNYWDCLPLLDEPPSLVLTNKPLMKVMRELEENYNCSGICRMPIFWTFLSI